MHDGRGKNHQAYLWQYSHPAGPVVFADNWGAIEELQVLNEELLASNEELQSNNEELEPVNDELGTGC